MFYQTLYLVNQTPMIRILIVLSISLLAGILLASGAMSWPVRPGLIGLGAMLVSAWVTRRYWQSRQPEDGPSSRERAQWHGVASYGLLTGHLATFMWRLGPALDMHSLTGHALALDNWTLVFGAIVSYWIARDPEPRSDERDALINTRGWRAGHIALLIMLLLLSLALAFGKHAVISRLNQPMLGQLLILLVLVDCLVQYVVRLRLYWLETQAERGAA